MAIDHKYLQNKLAQLEGYIQAVTELRKEPKEVFATGEKIEDAAERRLEKSIQCVVDIASYIVTRQALGNPTQYRDLFFFLGREGILSSGLVDRLEKMTGFRNILIHEYAVIDTTRVQKAVYKDIDDLTLFAKEIQKAFLMHIDK